MLFILAPKTFSLFGFIHTSRVWHCSLVFELGINGQTYPDSFPCEDSSWTYQPSAGKCYKLASATGGYNLANAVTACNQRVSAFNNLKINVAELRSNTDVEALKSALIDFAIKEKINIGAQRVGKYPSIL